MRLPHNVTSTIVIVLIAIAAQGAGDKPQVGQDRPVPSATMQAGVLHVEKFGSGEPALVFIPGLASGTWVWDAAIRQFSATNTIYAVTLPGFDGTTATSAPVLDKVDASLAQLIENEHLVRPVLVGHSIGGFLAIRFAEEHPEKLRGIITVDGLPVLPPLSQMTADERAAAARRTSAGLRTATSEQFAKQQQGVIPTMVTDPAQASHIASLTSKSNPAATADYVEEMMDADLRPSLAKDSVPTLVLAPVPSKPSPEYPPFMQNMTPKELSATLMQFYQTLLVGAPHASVAPIANSLHFAMIDQPQAVNDAIATFLKSVK
jgi:pimeloyl-ACP methyl ester carboxylesterase